MPGYGLICKGVQVMCLNNMQIQIHTKLTMHSDSCFFVQENLDTPKNMEAGQPIVVACVGFKPVNK